MPIQTLKKFLDEKEVKYVTLSHSQAFTAQEIAAATHIPGRALAKTVIVRMDDEMAMVVLPATQMIDLRRLQKATGSKQVSIASEDEFAELFPGCEPGAMPPFGNLWNLKVFVDHSLSADENIAFSAGSHTEVVQLPYSEFAKLVEPIPMELGIDVEAVTA